MENLHIRRATTNDAERIADFSRQTFYETFAPHNTKEDMDKFLAEQFTRADLVKEVGAAGNIFLLAFGGEELLGYTRLRDHQWIPALNSDTTIEIARIYVSAAAIGKGVGKALMQACLQIAKSMDKTIIWLGVWEHNQLAIDFYKKWGFEKYGETGFLLGNDRQKDWLMKKKI